MEQIRQEKSALRDQVARLSERISVLEAQLAKDSHNSHLPPSSDRFHRQPRSLRKKSGKQPGGQVGHAGNTLKLSPTPDIVIVLSQAGKAALDTIGILADFQGVNVHDGCRSYWQFLCQHALCNVHHLQNLTFLYEQQQQVWAGEMKELLLQQSSRRAGTGGGS